MFGITGKLFKGNEWYKEAGNMNQIMIPLHYLLYQDLQLKIEGNLI